MLDGIKTQSLIILLITSVAIIAVISVFEMKFKFQQNCIHDLAMRIQRQQTGAVTSHRVNQELDKPRRYGRVATLSMCEDEEDQ